MIIAYIFLYVFYRQAEEAYSNYLTRNLTTTTKKWLLKLLEHIIEIEKMLAKIRRCGNLATLYLWG